MKAAVE
jgi:hypothetical protein